MDHIGTPVHGHMGDYYTEAERAYDLQTAINGTAERLLWPGCFATVGLFCAWLDNWWLLLAAPLLYWVCMRPYNAALKRADDAWQAELARYYSSLPGSQ